VVVKNKTKEKLKIALEFCEEEDKSVGFTLQYLQGLANVSYSCALNFLKKFEKEYKK